MTLTEQLLEVHSEAEEINYFSNDIKAVYKEFNEIKDKLMVIERRYFALQDRYLHQNDKHFRELCGSYFNDSPITKNINGENQ